MDDCRRLIISDTHIGSAFSREDEFLQVLKTVEFDELILAGDIIDFMRVPFFSEKSAEIYDYLSSIDASIVYVIGNHDISLKGFIGKTISGVKYVDVYEFTCHGRRFRIEHGDKYDRSFVRVQFLMNGVLVFVSMIERIFKFDLTVWWDKLFSQKKKLRRIWDIVSWNDDADVFIMGHTHIPEVLIWVDQDERIRTYVNTGDWVQHATYVTVRNGVVRLKNFLRQEDPATPPYLH